MEGQNTSYLLPSKTFTMPPPNPMDYANLRSSACRVLTSTYNSKNVDTCLRQAQRQSGNRVLCFISRDGEGLLSSAASCDEASSDDGPHPTLLKSMCQQLADKSMAVIQRTHGGWTVAHVTFAAIRSVDDTCQDWPDR